MGTFQIFEFDYEDYLDVVLLTDTDDPYFTKDEIYENLFPKRGSSFSVLIDMFLRNGYSFNRYTLFEFKGPDNFKSYLVNSRDISDNIKKCVKDYLVNNRGLLSNSSLTQKTMDYILGIS